MESRMLNAFTQAANDVVFISLILTMALVLGVEWLAAKLPIDSELLNAILKITYISTAGVLIALIVRLLAFLKKYK